MRLRPWIALAATLTASAHDLYLMPARFFIEKGGSLEFAIHVGDAFPESEVGPPPERLRDGRLTGAKGAAEMTGLRVDGKRGLASVKIPGEGTLLLSVRTIPNLIELTPAEFAEYAKEEGLEHVIAWRAQNGESSKPGRERYSKYAKALVVAGQPDGFFKHTLGFPIEILPESDPTQLKPGATLPIRVVVHGKPAAGVQVEASTAPPGRPGKTSIAGRTDREGRLSIVIPTAGRWRLHAVQMERCADQKAADWESFWASLTFEVR